jgi:Asfivirus DNA-directed RNA polymerase RPB1
MYDAAHAPYRVYDPNEINVKIDRGELISGVLDKNSISDGVRGSISHVIHNKSGPKAALDITFWMQQLGLTYQFSRGNSINIKDFMLPESNIKQIKKIESMLIADSERITRQLQQGKIIPPIGRTVTEYYEGMQSNALNPGDAFYEHIISGINPDTNNFYKMVITGSKGKFYNFKNVVAAIGSLEINGERMKEIFGGRVLPYFAKDDADPRSRGYVGNSYMSGVDSGEFMMLTMQERYQLINKALSTSITGEQNRRAIKNLESSIIDNQRKLVKDQRIIQFMYGGDGVDARFLEFVSFPTAEKELTNAKFEELFRSTLKNFDKKFNNKNVEELLNDEFQQLKEDKEFFQTLFLNFELTRGAPYSNKANLPFNIKRIIDDAIFNFQLKPNSTLDPVKTIEVVKEFLNRIDYVLTNEIQWRKKSDIPKFRKHTTKLLKINIRGYLNVKTLMRLGITENALNVILDDVLTQYSKSLIAYGTSVGILAAQSISEPMTQMVLDSHKTAAAKSTRKQGMFRIKEILGAKPTEKMKAPSMTIFPIEEIRKNKSKVQEIANKIEMMEFRRFVSKWQLFFEPYGEPTHPSFKHESKLITEFEKYNIHIKPPADLTNWVLRIDINKSELILKQMKIEMIYDKIRSNFPFTHIVYSHDNSEKIVMRIYVRNSFAKKGSITTIQMQNLMDEMLNTVIRGVSGIRAAYVQDVNITEYQPDNSLKTVKSYNIFTDGTNVEEILEIPEIDPTTVQSDSVMEMFQVFGIACARTKIIDELRHQVDAASFRHYTVYADEMTYNGTVTSIDRYGSKKRDTSFMLRISDASPMSVIEEAALQNQSDSLKGVSAPIMVGKTPEVGDLYNTFKIDSNFVKSQVKSVDALIDAL